MSEGRALVYRRVLLKLSGEVLGGSAGWGIDPLAVERFVREVAEVHRLGLEVGLVIGGGNIWRGRSGLGVERVTADQMGMLATVINALALRDAFEKEGVSARVLTAGELPGIGEPFSWQKARRHLEKGRVVVFGGGTGNPFFSTDTAAALRGLEIGAEAILKGTKVDGVYDCDPKENPNALRFGSLSYVEVLRRGLAVMDAPAVSLCLEHQMPIVVFDVTGSGNLRRVIAGEQVGTLVSQEG